MCRRLSTIKPNIINQNKKPYVRVPTYSSIRFFLYLQLRTANEVIKMDYRIKYKKYYGIEFDSDVVVHHIDFDRSNNDISNLVALPKSLHQKYHMILNALSINPEKPKADGFIDMRLSNTIKTFYDVKMLEALPSVICQCSKFIMWRNYNYDAGLLPLFETEIKNGLFKIEYLEAELQRGAE